MRASVIVVSYNSGSHLEACLSSILRRLGPGDEPIAVDKRIGRRQLPHAAATALHPAFRAAQHLVAGEST